MLDDFSLLRLAIHLRCQDGEWPTFKGFLLHGAMGATLARLSPEAFTALMGQGGEVGRPYVLIPPWDEARRYLPGSLLTMELTLFGPAIFWALPCLLALQQMGATGLGKGGARFVVDSVYRIDPKGSLQVYSDAEGLCGTLTAVPANDILEASRSVKPLTSLAVRCPTPLRLKSGNVLVRQAPPFSVLCQRLFARVAMLERGAGDQSSSRDMKAALLDQATRIESAGHRLAWVDLPRFSSRQREEMQFGGLVGEMRFQGDLTPFAPWWSLAEYLSLGGKTTFGLGAIRVSL